MKLETIKFQDMLSKAVKGAGNNKLLPVTGLLGIKLKDGVLTLITTDATTYLFVMDAVDGDDFNVTVEIEKFYKLISKITTKEISLDVVDGSLIIRGNGNYKLEIPYDENGGIINYPDPREKISGKLKNQHEVPGSVFSVILSAVKPALSKVVLDEDALQYMSYYCGDKVVATDSNVVSAYLQKVFDSPKLVRPEMMALTDVMDSESVTVSEYKNVVMFETDNCVIYSTIIDQLDRFNIRAVDGLLEKEFTSMCVLPKSELLQLLDRFALFTDKYSYNSIQLDFSTDALTVRSLNSGAQETIHYLSSESPVEFVCNIDLELLRSQVKSQFGKEVNLWYGVQNAVKITDSDIVKIIALQNLV